MTTNRDNDLNESVLVYLKLLMIKENPGLLSKVNNFFQKL